MKAFALVSVGPSHMDFGGMGYLKLVNKLRSQGVDISWLTYGHLMKKKLTEVDQPVRHVESLKSLWTPGANHIFAKEGEIDKDRLMHMKHFELMMKFEKPDFLILDRVFPFAGVIAQNLGIPYYVIGSPGGQWKLKRYVISRGIMKDKIGLRQEMSKRLHYQIDELNAYACSDRMNICFLPRAFYDDGHLDSTSHFVDLFDRSFERQESTGRIGVSFGNTELEGYILDLLPSVVDTFGTDNVDIFCPRYHKSYEELKKTGLEFSEWAPFDEALPKLDYLVYFGGISSTWYCLQYKVNMVIASSGLDDQHYNSERVTKTGVGMAVDREDNFEEKLQKLKEASSEKLTQMTQSTQFTDDLDTVCSKILEY